MTTKQWKKQWKSLVRPTKFPGVWERKDGGHIVRTKVRDPATGKRKEIRRVLLEANAFEACQWLQEEAERARTLSHPRPSSMARFCDYAVSLLEQKLLRKEIISARSRERWVQTLRHLIQGTDGVAGFGALFLDEITVKHVETWKTGMATLIRKGDYAPTTINGWQSVLAVVMKQARREWELPTDVMGGIRQFDTSEHMTYTEEEPNALTEEEMQQFLPAMHELFPQFYAMTFLGFATGLRPSSMRPLRRAGATPDVLWDKGIVLVRRSHTLGPAVMDTTKTKRHQRISVPAEVIDVLQWHVATQLTTPEQKASELLFPSEAGAFRSEACLKKPFAEVGKAIGLTKHFTPRGLRRTFNDLARRANVGSLITKSISGHSTDRMKDHYSTVSPSEQRTSIERVLQRVKPAPQDGNVGEGSAPTGQVGAPLGAPSGEVGAPEGSELH